MVTLTNNYTTKNLRSSLNFKNEYSTENSNITKNINTNNTNNIYNNTLRVIGNEKNIGYIAGSQGDLKNINMRKEGKNK
jgi:hypothetical protein